MARFLDTIIVVDVEATCWDGTPPVGQTQEIIEVGITQLSSESGERFGKQSILVTPTRSQISPFCTQLTTLTPELLNSQGGGFREACKRMDKQLQTKQRVWASWGDFDRRIFERQCRAMEVPYPFGPTHLNVKTLYALLRTLPKEVGLQEAMRQEGLEFEGTAHRGDDDAWNIAAVLGRLLNPE